MPYNDRSRTFQKYRMTPVPRLDDGLVLEQEPDDAYGVGGPFAV
jgi:hypothetical protein